MKSVWPYYGGKWRSCAAKNSSYPRPLIGLPVIEPFAGAAGYSLANDAESAVLIDSSPYIYGCWNYLIKSSSEQILALPDLGEFELIDSLPITQEEKWLIGFQVNAGDVTPAKRRSSWARQKPNSFWGIDRRRRLAEISSRIKSWEVHLGTYTSAPDIEATWFIDPPYSGYAGSRYDNPYSIDYKDLGQWCLSRRGLVIVCEAQGASWLPFVPCREIADARGGYSQEVVFIKHE